MIAATVAVLLLYFGLGGGAFSYEKAFEPYLKEVIAEQSRYEQTVQLAKEADENLRQFKKEVREVWSTDLKALIADYDTTNEQFLAFYEKGSAARTAMQQDMLDIRFKVASIMTRDEWDALCRKIEEKSAEKAK